jgi:predicted permease
MAVMGQIFVLFSLIVLGYIIKKLDVVSSAINKEIGSFVLNVALPAFIVTSMDFPFSVEVLKDSAFLIVISFSVYGGSILLSKLYSKLTKTQGQSRDVMEYVIIFSNTGYMGYPVIYELFGEKGVFYAAIYNMSFNILVWSYGVHLLKSKDQKIRVPFMTRLRKIFNPGLVALLIGYTLFLTGFEIPGPLRTMLTMVGSTTTPLSMMFIGFILTEVRLKDAFFNWHMWAISGLRLVLIPVLTFFVLSALGFEGLTLYIPVVISAMPAAANTAIFSSQLGSDYRLGSLLIFASTLLSVGTIPLLIFLVR